MRPALDPIADDRDLATALMRGGDETAFRTLYRRHTPVLYQIVLRMLGGSEADAEDAVQDTWIRATTRLASFRWESSFRTWLVGIGLNRAREILRRRGRRPTTELDEANGRHAPITHDGDRLDLERAIARLPDGSRAVLVLHDVEGFTHEEIGRRLRIAVGTSRSQLFAARRALRARLKTGEELPHAR